MLPGSTLYRLLTRVAEAVARRLSMVDETSPDEAGLSEEPPKSDRDIEPPEK
jgi:hypothetical protein